MTQPESQFERRTLLRGATAAGLGAMLGGNAAAARLAQAVRDPSHGALPHPSAIARLFPQALAGAGCTLTPQAVEGPFYLDVDLIRQDITEGKPGLPHFVAVQMLDVNNACQPIPNFVFDVWQCDAEGSYSGFASEGTAGETFLRGVQFTDQNGIAIFQTVFPGVYPGRTTHIHFKARQSLESQLELTGQLYFDDFYAEIINQVLEPYASNPAPTTFNNQDGLFLNSGGAETTMFTIVNASPLFLVSALQIRVPGS